MSIAILINLDFIYDLYYKKYILDSNTLVITYSFSFYHVEKQSVNKK